MSNESMILLSIIAACCCFCGVGIRIGSGERNSGWLLWTVIGILNVVLAWMRIAGRV